MAAVWMGMEVTKKTGPALVLQPEQARRSIRCQPSIVGAV